MEKLNYEIVKQKLFAKGYILLDKEYTKNNIPLLISKDGYKAYMSYANFSQGEKPAFFVMRNPFIQENVCRFIKQYSPLTKVENVKWLVKGQRKRIMLSCVCGCGNHFEKLFDGARRDKRCLCPKCSAKERIKKRRKDKNVFISLCKEKKYEILNMPEEFAYTTKVEVQDQQGYRGYTSCASLNHNRHFNVFDLKHNKDNYIHNINAFAKNNNIKTKALCFADTNKWANIGILFECECGKRFSTTANAFQTG